MTYRSLFPLFAIVLLTGCATYPSTEVKLTKDDLSSKSVVLLSSGAKFNSLLFGEMQQPVHNIWARLDDKYFTAQALKYDLSSAAFLSSATTPKAHMIEPGNYVLESFGYQIGNVIYSSKGRGYSKRLKLPTRTLINVKAGEVVYIGHLLIDTDQTLKFVDHFDEAKTYIKTNYPDLENKLTKKLAVSIDSILE